MTARPDGSDERARRLRERFAAASPRPAAEPKRPRPPGARTPLLIWAILLALSVVQAIFRSL
ncbi:MAG: hypothetical protein ACOY4K_11810 [Pseudomonadota bacterium]